MHKPISRVAAAVFAVAFSVAPGLAPAQRGGAAADSTTAKVRVIPAGAMSREDAEVVASHREALTSAAELNGYDIATGSWIQNQVICPDAPRHVLMHYLKIYPDGSLSLFTAAVPRGADGNPPLRVRIVPVLYHGAPAFHTFGSSPSQRELINEVISTGSLKSPAGADTGWTSLAYCYAALAGAEPTTRSVTAPEEITPTLEMGSDKKVREMRFSVLGPDHLLQDWKIEFDKSAQVKAIVLSAKPVHKGEPLPEKSQGKARPVPGPKSR